MFVYEKMLDHGVQDVANALVGQRIEHLLAASLGPQHARGTQQTEVVTHEGRRKLKLLGNPAGGDLPLHASHDNGKTGGVGQKTEGLGKLGRLI